MAGRSGSAELGGRFIRQIPRAEAKQGTAQSENRNHPAKFEEHPHWFYFTPYDEPPACPPQAEGLRKSSGTLARQLLSKHAEGGVQVMLAGAIVAVLLIFGLFLSMLSSSPRAESECHPDTDV